MITEYQKINQQCLSDDNKVIFIDLHYKLISHFRKFNFKHIAYLFFYLLVWLLILSGIFNLYKPWSLSKKKKN